MDVHDVTSEVEYIGIMRNILAAAEAAARRKGQKPRDHPPPWMLVQRFMMKMRGKSNMDSRNMFTTSQVPEPYLPCVLPAAQLEPILISQMKLETHHRGQRIVVRCLTPPDRMNSVMAIVEDEEGTAVLLQLYHQAPEEVVSAAALIQPGTLFLLKEPFFKASTDGSYSLRSDHPTDVMLLDEADELVPVKWRNSLKALADASMSLDLRIQGNNAVGKMEWFKAEQLYSSAIKVATIVEEERLALLNRSLANLRLGRPASALSDAVIANKILSSEKGLFREASALYQLGRFNECLLRLETLNSDFPLSDAATPMMGRVRTRVHEQQTGEYDFRAMYGQARTTPPLIDCATYSKPVEVRVSPGRGRGLFTTRKVAAGELLVCEKALGYKYVGDDQCERKTILMNVKTKRMTVGAQADVLTQIVQKLCHDPVAARSFLDIYHGDYETVPADEVDGKPVVDSFLVERVIALTGFGSPRISRGQIFETKGKKMGDHRAFGTSGLYPLTAHINHSCVSNCHRSFIGDVQIVRATQDIDEDTELSFWYLRPLKFEPYNEAQKRLSSWGFRCECTLCLARKDTPSKTTLRRKSLNEDLEQAMGLLGSSSRPVDVRKARKVLEQLEGTYSAVERRPGAVRLELWDPYFALGNVLLMSKKYTDAIEVTVLGLEALGFVIAGDIPGRSRGAVKADKAGFRVEKWGLVEENSVEAFLTLFQAYRILAPELSAAIREYLGIVFSMVVGEKDTVLDIFPELCS